MPNYGHTAICPFYMGEKPKTISCEDAFRRFKDEKRRDAWTSMYCYEWDWMKCPYAADLSEAYERYEKGDEMALENHENEALRKELKSVSTRLGRIEKRCERQQKKIDELRAVNQSLVNVNENLTAQNKRIYKQWRELSSRNEAFEEKVFDQVQKISRMYEQRICYLIEEFVPDKAFRESDVSRWAEDKAFALVYEKDDEDQIPRWVVKFGEETETEDGQKDTELQTNEAEVRKPESTD